MKTLKQLLRQPLKSFTGLVFMTLAAAIVCLCVGQALAASSTKKDLDQRFSTVAIASLQEELQGSEMIRLEQELMQWLEKTAQAHPDIIKGIAPNGMLSAYIPQMAPYNTQAKENVNKYSWDSTLYAQGNQVYAGTTHYDSAMLVITLEEISEPISPMEAYALREQMPETWFASGKEWVTYLQNQQYQAYLKHNDYDIYQDLIDFALENTLTDGYTVELTGTVLQAVAVPDGMSDPVGMTARLTLTMPSLEAIEALELVAGEHYIVYGMDYVDDYQLIVEYMKQSSFKHITFTPYDATKLRELTPEEHRSFLGNKKINPVILYNYVPLEKWQFERFNSVSMTLCQPVNLIPYQNVLNDAGEVIDRIPQTEVTYTDRSGQTYTVSMEEYNARYAVPTITRLNGSLEDFLASQAGEQWKTAMEQAQINYRSFAVFGIDDMHQLPAFALGKTQMGEGREFTAEEVESGAKVCIVHEWVANNAGLQIGDTITLSFYGTDCGLPYDPSRVQELLLKNTSEAQGTSYSPVTAIERGLLRPSAGLYFSTTPITETAEYTIVGFWQGSVWPDVDANYYNFSANTVFVPYSSVESTMERTDSISTVSVVLENGMIRDFHELVKRGGYAGRFKYTDQGYADIAVNFHNYEALAQQIMLVGVVLYVLLLLLFLLLYPASQGKTVHTMESLGCHFGKRFGHVLLYAMAILLPASALGGWLGSLLWERMVAALQATTESSIALQLAPGVLTKVSLAQLAVALVLSACVAIWVAFPRGISKRR